MAGNGVKKRSATGAQSKGHAAAAAAAAEPKEKIPATAVTAVEPKENTATAAQSKKKTIVEKQPAKSTATKRKAENSSKANSETAQRKKGVVSAIFLFRLYRWLKYLYAASICLCLFSICGENKIKCNLLYHCV